MLLRYLSCEHTFSFTIKQFKILTCNAISNAAKVQVGFGRCVYHWPVFAGDTVKKTFKVEKVRNTSDGNHSVSLVIM